MTTEITARAYPVVVAVVVVPGAVVVAAVVAGAVEGVVVGTLAVVGVVLGAVVVVAGEVDGEVVDWAVVLVPDEVCALVVGPGCVVCLPFGVCRVARIPTAAPAAPSRRSAPTSRGTRAARRRRGRRGSTIVSAPAAVSLPTGGAPSLAASAAPSGGRRRGSFASESVATAARSRGTSGRKSSIAGGSALRCIRASSTGESLSNGNRPVSIRYSRTPNE